MFSVILLCHVALCSSWLCCVFTRATICTLCYHITFVVRWKDFWKWKKKKIRLVQKWLCIAILHVDMRNGYKNIDFWLWKIQNGKKIKGCWIYVRLFWVCFIKCMVKVTQTHCLFLTEDQLADSQLRQQHTSLPVQLSVSRHSQKNCTDSQSHHLCCLLAEIHWNEKKKIELHSDCLVEQYRRESFG